MLVVVSFSGRDIDAIRFDDPWPMARYDREGSHFIELGTEKAPMFRLPLLEGNTTVFRTAAASDFCIGRNRRGFFISETVWLGSWRQSSTDILRGQEQLAHASHLPTEPSFL